MSDGMNFEETLRIFSEYVENLHYDDILSPEIEDNLKKEYGAPRKFTLDYSKINVPTTEDYIEKASDYLSHEHAKGFLKEFHQDEFKKEVSRNYYMRKSINKKKAARSKIINPDQLCQKEPFQKFWLNSGSVQKAIEQIKELPFLVQEDRYLIVSRLIELTSSYVRILKHHNQIENPKLSETQKNRVMHDFILKIREFYQIVVQEAISKHMIDQRKFPKDQKDKFTFPEELIDNPIPKKKKQKPNILDERDIGILYQTTNPKQFPSCYRLNFDSIPNQIPTNQTKQQQKIFDQQTSKMLKTLHENISSLPPISQSVPPKSPRQMYDQSNIENEENEPIYNPKLSKLLIIENDRPKHAATQPVTSKRSNNERMELERQKFLKEGWKRTEKLRNRSGRPISNLEILDNITNSFGFNYDDYKKKEENVKLPFKLTQVQQKDGPNLIDDIWNTASLVKNRSKSELQNKPKDPPKESIKEKNNTKSTFDTISQFKPSIMANLFNTSESVRFLNKYSFEKIQKHQQRILDNEEIEDELGGNSISERLINIWDELGFTPKQRINLLLKYTESPDKSIDLKGALDFWENSLAFAKKYDKAYKELKSFLLNESDTMQHKGIIFDQMSAELNNAESSLSLIASQLLSQHNDELIFHKLPIQKLIDKRNKKIKDFCIAKGLIEDETIEQNMDDEDDLNKSESNDVETKSKS